MRILLVEDDELLGNGIHMGLSQEGYAVDWTKDGQSAESAILLETFDAIILDIGLPYKNGIEVLKTIRTKGITTPVMVLTATADITMCINALDLGADDFIVKPFELNEVCARLRALLRRATGRADPILIYGDIALDPAAHLVTKNNQPLNIPPKEFSILLTLMEHAGQVISREKLAENLYGWENEIDSNAVEVHIHNLRKKLGTDIIQTIHGIGYVINKITIQDTA